MVRVALALLLLAAPARAAEAPPDDVILSIGVCDTVAKQCRLERLPGVIPAAECALHAQQIAIGWLDEHPRYRFAGTWTCKPPSKEREL
jgi:hypothetical protein